MRMPVSILHGERRFAWTPVELEDGRRAWLRFVFRLRPLGGVRPTFAGRPVLFTDRIPFCDPSLRGWLRAGLVGRILAMRARLLGYLLLWLLAVFAITELTGWLFSWPVAFGGVRVGDVALYWPGQFLGWRGLPAAGHRWIVDLATGLSLACAAAVGVRIWLDLTGSRLHRFGAGRWAARADVRRSGLL
ncbi:hypothetical protein [Azospirillum sp.]|uniref:hypothetical protein n=1 Tax=Azospirillum sp. TaxID=34012 RepID=UPI002D67486A|nr:hypothetical protein [Azospirillum sp.]HYD69180.1 hypothetical protein [Azospirillum sp.]